MTRDAQLRQVVRDPASWFSVAANLSYLLPELWAEVESEFARSRADHSYPAPRLMPAWRAFLLLAGYAVENYLKGLSFLRAPAQLASAPPDPFLPESVSNHKLAALAAGLHLEPQHGVALELLQRSVTWYARYPVPKQPEGFQLFGPESSQGPLVLSLVAHLHSLSLGQPGPA